MKVLPIDDEESISRQAKIFLEEEIENLEIRTNKSAEDALDCLEEKNGFDVIVFYYQMPRMTGIEFFENNKRRKHRIRTWNASSKENSRNLQWQNRSF